MFKVTKAVIPAAGYGTRFLPATKSQPKEMLPIIDKPTIQFIVEEAVKSGITDIIIITSHQKASIENHFDRSLELEMVLEKAKKYEELKLIREISELVNIHYVRQKEQLGLGHAILCAKTFVGNEPFAVLLGDDVVRNDEYPAIKQLIDVFLEKQRSIVGVQKVAKSEVHKYGIVSVATPITLEHPTAKVIDMIEKPKLEEAPSEFAVLGRYVLTPDIFTYLETQQAGSGNEIQLTDSIRRLAKDTEVYAYQFIGKRYDVGSKIGYLEATIDYALSRKDLREDFISLIKQRIK
ncbi:MAG TPA: UTP--glucose-1-phosphate uridylyltransferase GalU [Bacilli bacterium]|nr:UTP--glucose-1-phosphate uridylyltransferase GalU [Bacilli bacterium]HQA20189.1 UTP--glucose-1-phosphate uridylyltransferase GalU [Bacilli bacterium]HQD92350.1 UTP--glucose-1-phosphate uridylyltransferase GalU [Bacilli bacterium]